MQWESLVEFIRNKKSRTVASNGVLVETKVDVDQVNILIMWMLHIETVFQEKIVWKTTNIKCKKHL